MQDSAESAMRAQVATRANVHVVSHSGIRGVKKIPVQAKGNKQRITTTGIQFARKVMKVIG